MKRKQYLLKNVTLFALNSIGTRLISFLLIPLYTAILTTDEYGTADLVTTIATIAVPILTLNIGEAVMRFCLDDYADHNKIMSVGITVMISSVIASIIILPVTYAFNSTRNYSLYIFLYCISHGSYQIAVCYLRGKEKLTYYALSNLIHVFITSILNIVFLSVLHWGLQGYFLAYIFGYTIALLFALISGRIGDVIRNFKIDGSMARDMIRYSILLVPTSFMWWIMNSSDRIMVTSMVGIAANGIYAVSYKIPTVLSTMSTVFNQAWSYSAIKENQSTDREAFNNTMFSNLVVFQAICTGFLLLVIKQFLKIYVSVEYYSSWQYTPYLLIGYYFMSLGTFLSTSYTVNKDSKGFLKSGLVGAIVNILLNWLLIPIIGVAGAALATCISYFIVFLYRSIDTRKYLTIHILTTRNVISTIILLIMAVTVYFNSVFLIIEFVLLLLFNMQNIFKYCKMSINLIKGIKGKIKNKRSR